MSYISLKSIEVNDMREIMEKDPGKRRNIKHRTETLVWTHLSKNKVKHVDLWTPMRHVSIFITNFWKAMSKS